MRHRVILLFSILALVFALLPRTAQAQDNEDMCTQLLRQVLTDLGTNCANMESNTACYGFETVEATFVDDTADGFFAEPGDRAELTSLAALTTSQLDVEESVWGIGSMRVQANIHNALDKQAVFIAVGDVTIENAVEPETALLPVEPVSINTVAGANLYKTPDAASELLGTVPSGVTLQVDGISEDGLWLRAMYDDGEKNRLSWVSTDMLDASVDTSSLPVITSESRSPMQAFFLRNDVDYPECANAVPPLLLVQVPKNTEIDIVINGTPIRIGSTVIFQVRSSNLLRVTTLFGMATIDPDTPDELLIPPGFFREVCLSEPDDYGGLDEEENDQVRSCPWTGIEMVLREDMSRINFLTELPDNIVDYVINLPIVVPPSGIGGAIDVLFFIDPDALDRAQDFCDAGELPVDVCIRLFY